MVDKDLCGGVLCALGECRGSRASMLTVGGGSDSGGLGHVGGMAPCDGGLGLCGRYSTMCVGANSALSRHSSCGGYSATCGESRAMWESVDK